MSKIVLFDIDDTLLTAKNIFIYKKILHDKEHALTTYQYGKEYIKNNIYDFRDFNCIKKSIYSIKNAEPIDFTINLLNLYHKENNSDIGFITARSFENETHYTLSKWLKRYSKSKDITIKRNFFHAISDINNNYPGITISDKKANIIKNYSYKYNSVLFIDDDIKNINKILDLNLTNVKTLHFNRK